MSQSYSIRSETRGEMVLYSLCEPGAAYAQVAPGAGNNCFVFRVGAPVLEPVSMEAFHQRPTGYGIPILCPFPNRIRDGRFRFREDVYSITPGRHGFVRDKRWTVLASGASDNEGAWLRCGLDAAHYPEEILAQFPFPFTLTTTYRLKDGRLHMETMVQNTGDRDMPLGFGLHPYFRRPAHGSLLVPARKRWELIDFLPTGARLDVEPAYDLREPTDLADLVLDDIYTDLVPDSDGLVRCRLNDVETGVETVVEFDGKEFPHVVVYTPPAPRQAICIEPCSCPTDAFNLYARGIPCDLTVLPPHAESHFNVQVYTRKHVP